MPAPPLAYPAPIIERFTITNTGSLTLTEPQRMSYAFSVFVEKVKFSSRPEYYNFRVPEPESFWGYIQLVNRDFIQKTIQLEYRRQELINIENTEFVALHELRCLLGAHRKYNRRYFQALLAQAVEGDDTPPSTEDITQAEIDMDSAENTAPPIPTLPTTAIWYEFPPGFGAQITMVRIDYPSICRSSTDNQAAPPAPAPSAGESGGDSSGGGGDRGAPPPPIGRRSDPLSDSPAPPPDSPDGPPTAVPGQARVRLRITGSAINGQNLGCNVLVPVDNTLILEGSEYTTDLGDYSCTLDGSFDPGGCVGSRLGYTVRFRGNPVGAFGPAGFYDAPVVVDAEAL